MSVFTKIPYQEVGEIPLRSGKSQGTVRKDESRKKVAILSDGLKLYHLMAKLLLTSNSEYDNTRLQPILESEVNNICLA